MAQKIPAQLHPEDQRQMLTALRERTKAATKAVNEAAKALQDLKRVSKVAQQLGELMAAPTDRQERKTSMPATNTHEARKSSLTNGHG